MVAVGNPKGLVEHRISAGRRRVLAAILRRYDARATDGDGLNNKKA